ncbi:MAG TPA: hypothetical protein VFF06_12550 [Polyangia bacterium]|nr:hypothetical protein [Polyangia bacterium]
MLRPSTRIEAQGNAARSTANNAQTAAINRSMIMDTRARVIGSVARQFETPMFVITRALVLAAMLAWYAAGFRLCKTRSN